MRRSALATERFGDAAIDRSGARGGDQLAPDVHEHVVVMSCLQAQMHVDAAVASHFHVLRVPWYLPVTAVVITVLEVAVCGIARRGHVDRNVVGCTQ